MADVGAACGICCFRLMTIAIAEDVRADRRNRALHEVNTNNLNVYANREPVYSCPSAPSTELPGTHHNHDIVQQQPLSGITYSRGAYSVNCDLQVSNDDVSNDDQPPSYEEATN